MISYEETEHGRKYKSPIKAIRAQCVDDCCGGSPSTVAKCDNEDCPLYAYRFGKNPFNKRKMTAKQRKAASERFKKMWADKGKSKKMGRKKKGNK